MKKTEIKVGGIYADGKGGVREVIADGSKYVLYAGQEESDCLRYVLREKKRGPGVVGQEYNSTRASFAAWAKTRITPEGAV